MDKTFMIDVHWDVAKCYHVKASSKEEAVEKVQKMMDAGELSYSDDGYESTDDTEILLAGEIGENGEEVLY
jgi:hypothetical protein